MKRKGTANKERVRCINCRLARAIQVR